MSWIMIKCSLPGSRKMMALARELQCDRATAVGAAVTWLIWLESQTTDGRAGVRPEELDALLQVPGLGRALLNIGWAVLDAEGLIQAVEWDLYNGKDTRRRLLAARRAARARAKKAQNVTHERDESNAGSVTNVTLERDAERDESNAGSVTNVTQGALLFADSPKVNTLDNPINIDIYNKDVYNREPNTGKYPNGHGAEKEARGGVPAVEEVVAVMGSLPRANVPKEELRLCAEQWLDTMRSSGWLDSKGRPVKDWRASARCWARGWATNLAEKRSAKKGSCGSGNRTNMTLCDNEQYRYEP